MPTEADRELANEFYKQHEWTPINVDIAAAAIAFARERWQQEQAQSQPAEPPLPDKLPAHCFAVVECERSTLLRWDRSGALLNRNDSDATLDRASRNFFDAKRTIHLPPGSVVFVATGEVRSPKAGEWFISSRGTAIQAGCNYSDDYPIVHRIEVTK